MASLRDSMPRSLRKLPDLYSISVQRGSNDLIANIFRFDILELLRFYKRLEEKYWFQGKTSVL